MKISDKQAAALGLVTPRKSKYRAVRTEYAGTFYDSKAEAAWAKELDWRKKIGLVEWWLRQTKVVLDSAADFSVRVDFVVALRRDNGGLEVEAHDVKGKATRDWPKIKRMWAAHGPFPLKVIRFGKVAEVIEPKGGAV